MKEAKIITDRSEVHRTYLIIYGTLGICLLGYAAMTVRYIWNMHQIPWMDVLTEIIFLLFLGSTALARSTYELHEKELVVISSSLFRTRKLAIPYSAIDGAFHFKVEPIKAISYRHTYRMYGSMDRRDIWSLVYNMPNTDKVSRVLMKASEEFWEAFEKKLPGRIRVSQEEVLKNAFLYISGAEPKKNKNRAKKAAAADALEEAEEARAQESAQDAGPQAAPQDAAPEIRDAAETAAPAPAEESAPEKEPAAAPSGEAEAADKAETAKKEKE